MSFQVFHPKQCECGANLEAPDSVEVRGSIDGQEFVFKSCVDDEGALVDSHEGAVSKGLHAGSVCRACLKNLPEACYQLP